MCGAAVKIMNTFYFDKNQASFYFKKMEDMKNKKKYVRNSEK